MKTSKRKNNKDVYYLMPYFAFLQKLIISEGSNPLQKV